jgi:hypothetical protein
MGLKFADDSTLLLMTSVSFRSHVSMSKNDSSQKHALQATQFSVNLTKY